MSIADKLRVIAENVPKVYRAGASDFGLVGSAEGEVVTFGNVHPKEHRVNVKLSSKNLLDKNNYVIQNGGIGFSLENLAEGEQYVISSNLPINQMKISYEPTKTSCSGGLYSENGFNERTWLHQRAEGMSADLPLYIYFGLGEKGSFVTDISQLEGYELQIEKGSTATKYTPYISDFSDVKVTASGSNLFDVSYEPYIGAEYIANADGTVEGVKSISPTMNISADRAGVTVSAECFLDPEAVREELTNAILTLGGEI